MEYAITRPELGICSLKIFVIFLFNLTWSDS